MNGTLQNIEARGGDGKFAPASATERVLVTGADGFVGRALCRELGRRGIPFRAAVRRSGYEVPAGGEVVRIADLSADTNREEAFRDVSAVIHLAARVHVMREEAADPLGEFRKVNVLGTERLARAAAACGVRRFVFVSSIKVNGETTRGDERFSASDAPAPQDAYGVSKREAEETLWRVAAETGLEIVVVRPPLVYGPGVKGNFASLIVALRRGIPLPLASVRNRRSLIYVRNLADALILCATHPAAAMRTFLVSDGEDLSTADLLRRLGAAMGRPARLLPCPLWLLRRLGKGARIERLTGSLRVADEPIRRELGWSPPCTVEQGLKATVEYE